MEKWGVLAKPEDLGIVLTHVHPCILLLKGIGKFRLVTDFRSIQNFVKPLPTLMPTVSDAMTALLSVNFHIELDFSIITGRIRFLKKILRNWQFVILINSVSDPSHSDMDPDPGIHIWEKWIQIRILGSTFGKSGSGSGSKVDLDPDPSTYFSYFS